MRKLLTLLFVAISAATFAQAPQGINYQAVIRDNGGAVLANQAVGMKVAILQGSPSGTAVYEESFSPTTSQFGLVNVVIGQGTIISGDFTTIDWSAGPYYAEVSADETGGTNYTVLGTQQLMSVPYSLYAETAENVTNDQVDDADADPNNEIQDISLTGTDLTISSGSTVDLSVIQDGVNDADADPNNEIQAISFSNDTLYLSNGGQVYLGAYGVDLVDDADADPTNELQNWSNLPGVPAEITDGDDVDDADADPNNEIQALSLSNDTLYLSGSNNVFIGNSGGNNSASGYAQIGKNPNAIEDWSIPGWRVVINTNASVAPNTIMYTPIYVADSTNYTGVGFELNVANAGDICRIGLYSWSDGLPDQLLFDFGTVDCSSSGNKIINVNFSLSPGYYFVAASKTGSGSSMTVSGAFTNDSHAPVSGRTLNLGSQTTSWGFIQSDTGGNFTTNGYPLNPTITTGGYGANCFIYFRE